MSKQMWDARRAVASGLRELATARRLAGDHQGAQVLRQGSRTLFDIARREESTAVDEDRLNRLAAKSYREDMETPLEDPEVTLEDRVAKALAEYEWRYLPRGSVAHAVGLKDDSPRSSALCGVSPNWFSPANWMGTGSQEEYEKAASLPKCKSCAGIITKFLPAPARTHQLVPTQGSTF